VKFKVAVTGMYPRIPWELVVDPLGSAEQCLGTTALDEINCSYVKTGPMCGVADWRVSMAVGTQPAPTVNISHYTSEGYICVRI
jgi:hypothetical protein